MNIYDIAELAGVSIATVSRALSDSVEINPETKNRILKLMKGLNYHPNVSARRLTKKTTETIAVYFWKSEIPPNATRWSRIGEIFEGIQKAATEDFEYETIFQVPYRDIKEDTYIKLYNQKRVDGAIVVFPYIDDPYCFETQMRMSFIETGEVDEDLYLRNIMEVMARKGISTNNGRRISSREADLLAHHYARIISHDHIVGFKDYMVFCKRMLVGISNSDMFESYLAREKLPSVDECLSQI